MSGLPKATGGEKECEDLGGSQGSVAPAVVVDLESHLLETRKGSGFGTANHGHEDFRAKPLAVRVHGSRNGDVDVLEELVEASV